MNLADRRSHWDTMYRTRDETEVSWFEATPTVSLDLIAQTEVALTAAIIDVGGGASRLIDALIDAGYQDLTVIDLAEASLARARARLGNAATKVAWIVGDITRWAPQHSYQLWHDRAAFHFLIDPSDRAAYVERLTAALAQGGHAIIGTFALDGPQRCSNLPVERYDAAGLSTVLGPAFELIHARLHQHRTPAGAIQNFQFAVFRRRPE